MAVTSESTLKELVDETGLIKNELVVCRDNLKTNLSNKGVDTSTLNKMGELINSIPLIKIINHKYPQWYVFSENFISANSMPFPTSFPLAFSINELVYICGGASYTYKTHYSYNQCYCIETNTWTEKKGSYSGPRGTAVVCEGKAYCLGGSFISNPYAGSTINNCYDPVTDTWTSKAPLPVAVSMTSAVSLGNKIYCIGGYGNFKSNNCYDPVTDTWTSKAPLPEGRFGHSTEVYEGKIYCFAGGIDSNSYTSKTLCYDPIADVWQEKSNMKSARVEFVGGKIGDKMYCIGGHSSNLEYDRASIVKGVECYDFAKDSWQSLFDDMICVGKAGAVVGNYIVLGGGYAGGYPANGSLIFVKNT